jgi:hypothetical protein
VFISHTTRDLRDHALAKGLAGRLRALGSGVWIAPDDIPSGAEWASEIVTAILERCSHFLVVLSAASVSAEWVVKEIALARNRYDRGDLTILPLVVGRIDATPNLDFLSQFQQVPFHDDLERQVQEVASVLGLTYTPPPPPRRVQDAVGYLRRCTELDRDTVRQIRMVRDASPVPGLLLGLYLAGLLTTGPQFPLLVVIAVVSGVPAITCVVGIAAFVFLTAGTRAKMRSAQELENAVQSCPDASDGPCGEIWDRFERYRAGRTRQAWEERPVHS